MLEFVLVWIQIEHLNDKSFLHNRVFSEFHRPIIVNFHYMSRENYLWHFKPVIGNSVVCFSLSWVRFLRSYFVCLFDGNRWCKEWQGLLRTLANSTRSAVSTVSQISENDLWFAGRSPCLMTFLRVACSCSVHPMLIIPGGDWPTSAFAMVICAFAWSSLIA